MSWVCTNPVKRPATEWTFAPDPNADWVPQKPETNPLTPTFGKPPCAIWNATYETPESKPGRRPQNRYSVIQRSLPRMNARGFCHGFGSVRETEKYHVVRAYVSPRTMA